MPADRFLDTNILLYGYDLDAPKKRATAIQLLSEAWQNPGSAVISVQVLQEFYVNFVRKTGSHSEAETIIKDLCLWPIIDNSVELLGMALRIRARYDLSLWDAMIVAAAQSANCKELLTEDLNHGQLYGSVRVLNPFK